MPENLRPYKKTFPLLGRRVMVDSSSVVIGNVGLADDVSVWPLVTIRGDVNRITIGKRSNVQDGSILHVTHKSASNPEGYPLILGEDVTVGHKAILHGCKVGSRVLIGMGSILLDGVTVENDVMIGAGTLVPSGKHLVSGYLYIGSPARQSRPLSKEEINHLLYSSSNYVEWKNDYLAQESQNHP
ncbi:gamma carbonic anhydrase family protein [Erwinia tracheiphila]|uniref:Gamma carbonic anhydrase family protein n=1 Tax=Erwinia tracheiphila TaxID=65700 RepID=A0A345CXE3_9GAMM|nr:gamma carbonic anhydrase family protein [Erwinia tracheiphila]AXF78110.1 gamma carbonic anhydrase family protein [Erwinia tracheiphila]UIA83176.1 gamma carbonic anhydrase family protein [Erwinia tracheiphila]UIA91755.1 gamma carbonic anhydrase family protein [Erwinia tracheiphila]